jgi:hypothetical protein
VKRPDTVERNNLLCARSIPILRGASNGLSSWAHELKATGQRIRCISLAGFLVFGIAAAIAPILANALKAPAREEDSHNNRR